MKIKWVNFKYLKCCEDGVGSFFISHFEHTQSIAWAEYNLHRNKRQTLCLILPICHIVGFQVVTYQRSTKCKWRCLDLILDFLLNTVPESWYVCHRPDPNRSWTYGYDQSLEWSFLVPIVMCGLFLSLKTTRPAAPVLFKCPVVPGLGTRGVLRSRSLPRT